MRFTVKFLTMILLAASVANAGPGTISYQGSLLTPGRAPVADGPYRMTFGLYDDALAGTLRWSEEKVVDVRGGLFSTPLGDIQPFGDVFLNFPDLWLSLVIDVDLSGSYTPDEVYWPRQKLASAAWAVEADRLDGRHAGQFWMTGGNAGTNPTSHFIGTTDNNGLGFRVNNSHALRFEPVPAQGTPNIIGGFVSNRVTEGVVGATIGGGGVFSMFDRANRVTDNFGTIGGGANNQAGDDSATTSGANYATVAGGWGNLAEERYSTVGGGESNSATDAYATVAGGINNVADSLGATVGGGEGNLASGGRSTVAGGDGNMATALFSTVGGGQASSATARNATIAGGYSNAAYGRGATVGGGESNVSGGITSVAPGGMFNKALGNYSFAAGHGATADHEGSFVWCDATGPNVSSERQNQFRVKCAGGARFDILDDRSWIELRYNTADFALINSSVGARLTMGGVWDDSCDRNAKENFQPVDSKAILARVAELPLASWNYKTESADIRHLGPVAQDFHAFFGLGADDKHIAPLDTAGVALTAIQGLHQLVQEKDSEIAALKKQNADVIARLESLEAKFSTIADQLDDKAR